MIQHTKKELINLAPENSLDQHVSKLNLPDCIQSEIQEQKVFLGRTKIIAMCNWHKNQFITWYNQIVENERI